MKLALIFVFLLTAAGAFAGPDPRRDQLEAALARVQQEQQSLYQQFQMAQEMRRIELLDTSPGSAQGYSAIGTTGSARSIDFDENQRIQQKKQERLQSYEKQLGVTYSRFTELESRKQELLQQINELSLPPPPARANADTGAAANTTNAANPAQPYGNPDLRR